MELKVSSFQHILAPIDFTESSEHALDHAVELAAKLGARVTVLHAYSVPIYTFPDGSYIPTADLAARISAAAQAELDAAIARRKDSGVALEGLLRSGATSEVICGVASEIGADLIVMGTHGRGALARALLGSVAQNVVRNATQPVMTVRG
jgi:nucleotide-binding universal stress UspA family protein